MSARTSVNTSSEVGGEPSMTYIGLLAGGMVQMEFAGFIAKLNPELVRKYQRERLYAGTMGGR